MDIKTQDRLFNVVRVAIGAGAYCLCAFLAFACCRIGELCSAKGGIYMVGAVLFVGAYFLPVLFAGFVEHKCMRGEDGLRAAMFAVCAVLVLLFGLYAAFIDRSLMEGRDIAAELFLWLELLAVSTVYAVRSARNRTP
jgi:hypothetical protein